MPLPTASIWSASFATPEAMAAAQREAAIEYLSLTPARRYATRMTTVDLGPARILDVMDAAHMVRGTVAPGRSAILFPHGRAVEGLRVNGVTSWEDGGILLRANAEFLSITPGDQAWGSIVLDEERFGPVLDQRWMPRAGSFISMAGLSPLTLRLQGFARDIGRVAQADPARLAAGSVPAALLEEISGWLGSVCAPPEPALHRQLHLHRRLRLVRQAEDLLHAAIGQAIYTSEIADALGVSERSLGDAFSAVYGMSLQRYLRIRRLNLARRALSAGVGAPALVKTVALDLGFWNLGRFAREYRDLFGESPSETAARMRADHHDMAAARIGVRPRAVFAARPALAAGATAH